MRRVIVESPFRGFSTLPLLAWRQLLMNRAYARQAMLDCLRRGEAPFASHLIYTQVLHDSWEDERAMGISAGLAWVEVADATVVYTDRGISAGMQQGIETATRAGLAIEYRSIHHSPAGTR
jgi:hypothetical protein